MSILTRDDLVIDAHYRVVHNHGGHQFEIGQTVVFIKRGWCLDSFESLDGTEKWYLFPAEVLPLPTRAEWVSAVASGQTDLGYVEWAEPRPVPTERTYSVGIPMWITVKDSGEVEFGFDLSEAADDMETSGDYVEADHKVVSAAADSIKNSHTLTIAPQEAS